MCPFNNLCAHLFNMRVIILVLLILISATTVVKKKLSEFVFLWCLISIEEINAYTWKIIKSSLSLVWVSIIFIEKKKNAYLWRCNNIEPLIRNSVHNTIFQA